MPESSQFVNTARKLPFIYLSHFRSLYDAKNSFGLTNEQVLSLLLDIVMAEGSLSSRDIDKHTRKKYGKEKTWFYHAQRANKELLSMVNSEDFPKRGRKMIVRVIEWLSSKA